MLKVPTSQHIRWLISTFTLQKKHTSSQPKTIYICQLCQVFAGFQLARLHRQKIHNVEAVLESKIIDITDLVRPIDNESLMEELQTCKHFPVDSEIKTAGHRVFIFAKETLHGHTVSQKLVTVCEKQNCAAKLNVVFGFVIKDVEDETCRFTMRAKTTL